MCKNILNRHHFITVACIKKKKTRKSILTLFYKMTINNGTKKIEVPPKGIPCTCYVGSSVGRIVIEVSFLFLCARGFSVQYDDILDSNVFFPSLPLGIPSL